MSPTGIPDFGQNPTTNPTSPTYDSGEDATRLLYGFGSQARSGRWVYATGFEDNSLATLYVSPASTGTGVIGTTNAYMGARSLTLTTAATTNDTVSFQKIMLLPGNRMGMEVMWSKQSAGGGPFEIEFTISSQARGVDRNRFRNGKIVLVVGATLPDAKLYLDVNGSRTLIRDVSAYVQDLARYWHYVKIVYDINGNKIVRVYFDDLTIDVESYGYDTSGTSTPINQFSIQLKTKSAKAIIVNFDNFIVTADEPGLSAEYVVPPPPPSFSIDYLLVGGGGGTGRENGSTGANGGGAGGGVRKYTSQLVTQGIEYFVVIGKGGAGFSGGNGKGVTGGDTSFNSHTAHGGGGGGSGTTGLNDGLPGGSGGGAAGGGLAGNGTAGEGNNGGNSTGQTGGAGGGGAGGVGGNAVGIAAGAGGPGVSDSITGSAVIYGGGGGGIRNDAGAGAAGGTGGGGAGATNSQNGTGTPGTNGLGGGAGASGWNNQNGVAGGDGVAILRILTSNYSGIYTGTPAITTDGLYTILKFTSDGSYTP